MHRNHSNPYHAQGYADRNAYLAALADDYGPMAYEAAALLGPSEDFDGLPTLLEDHAGEVA
jgi:hypothetical protein